MKKILNAGLLAAALAAPLAAHADTFSFSCISNNSGICDASFGSQFTVDITAGTTAGTLDFLFKNIGPVSSFISSIYWDLASTTSFSSGTVANGVGTFFVIPESNPANLPGGNGINFTTTAGISAGATAPSATNGVSVSEQVKVTWASNVSLAQFIAALAGASGSTDTNNRIGLHVQGINGGTSDALVLCTTSNCVPQIPRIPEPSTWALMLAGLGLLGFMARRRARA